MKYEELTAKIRAAPHTMIEPSEQDPESWTVSELARLEMPA